MTINSTSYQSNELNYITEAGNYLLKLVKWETDGYSQNGDLKIKVACEAKKILEDGKLEGNYSINYMMFDGEKAGFTIAMLRDALKSPKVFNLDDWMGRFANAYIVMEEGNDGKMYARVKKFEYSKFNDKMPPFSEVKPEQGEPASTNVENNPSVEITDSEIPF